MDRGRQLGLGWAKAELVRLDEREATDEPSDPHEARHDAVFQKSHVFIDQIREGDDEV